MSPLPSRDRVAIRHFHCGEPVEPRIALCEAELVRNDGFGEL